MRRARRVDPRPGPPASDEMPVYRKVRQARALFLITVDEGWRSTVFCSGMYENDADWLIRVLGRRPRQDIK